MDSEEQMRLVVLLQDRPIEMLCQIIYSVTISDEIKVFGACFQRNWKQTFVHNR